MKTEILVALRMTFATFVLTGLAYPLAITGLAQAVFPTRANGSLVVEGGRLVGVDEERLRDDANRVAERLYKKAGIG